MRLWSLHPKFLDCAGLCACWRETLLAQAVLAGRTKGYKNHPQLERWREHPVGLHNYLWQLHVEAGKRNYKFDPKRIDRLDLDSHGSNLVLCPYGQVRFEFQHLQEKLKKRCPEKYEANVELWKFATWDSVANSALTIYPGPVESWEKTERRKKRA
jgi:hypothetical protein